MVAFLTLSLSPWGSSMPGATFSVVRMNVGDRFHSPISPPFAVPTCFSVACPLAMALSMATWVVWAFSQSGLWESTLILVTMALPLGSVLPT